MKQIFTKLYVIGLLLTISMSAFAQARVSGSILDADTEEPLIGATVVIKGTTTGTVTTLDGSFELEVKNETCELVFSYVGYVDQVKSINVQGDQNLGKILLAPDAVGLNEVQVLASVVTDRSTPVAVSSLPAELIVEKLGTQEYPELLKTTPSIYTSKEGGGFGDASVYVRGFDSNNVGVLINGIPVNDMESGKVYWSNWAGLSDVTRTMQVQRGLGASKLGLSSVGGTINILTKSTEARKGGSFKTYIGDDGYRKQLFTFSTGMMDNGWAVTVLGAHTYGDGYVKGTNFDAWSYFGTIAKRINEHHTLAFTVVGAPQWHNQRGTRLSIETYKNHKDGIKYNSNWGYRNGQVYAGAYGYNYYHKPQAQLNHYWTIDDNTNLTTSFYASVGQGGGRRSSGNAVERTSEDLLDWDSTIESNETSETGRSNTIIGNSVNHHQWYGLLSTWTKKLDPFKYTVGLDARYYHGQHYYEVDDLLGGDYYTDSNFASRDENEKLKVGDKYNYWNDGISMYTGLFAQGEYVQGNFTAFLSAAVSRKAYQRIDYYHFEEGKTTSEWKAFLPWNVKAGLSYKLSPNHTVYVNGGYVKRTPYFNNVFLNYTNEINDDAKYEQIITSELGYMFNSSKFDAKVALYRTNWKDKGLLVSYRATSEDENGVEVETQRYANVAGLNQLHSGVELEGTYKPNNKITLRGMFSYGNYIYQDDVHFALYDESQNLLASKDAFIKDVHVGNSAQTTGSLSVDYKVLSGLKVGVDYIYYGRHFADFDPEEYDSETDSGIDAWEMPEVGLIDLNFNYKFTIAGLDATIYGNVNNLFNTEYITKAEDGTNHDAYSAEVFYGAGTTWSTGLKVKF